MTVGVGAVRQLEYYRVVAEDTWGTDPGSGYTGIAFDDYGVELENEVLQQDKYTGDIDVVYADIVSQMLQGSITSQVWPDNAGLLLEMAGIQRLANEDVKSWTIHGYDRAKNEYISHSGLKCNSVDIAASGEDPKLKFTMEMIGKTETSISSFVKPTLPQSAAFEFHDGTFTMGGVTEDVCTAFSIKVNNNLSPSTPKDASRNIKWIDPGRRNIEVTFTVRTQETMAQHYRQLIRNRNAGLSLVVAFNYPGTGSPYDTLTFTLPALVLQSVVRTGGVGDIQTLVCTAIAKRTGASAAIVAAAAA